MVTGEVVTWVGSGVGRCNEDYADFNVEGGCAVLVDGATGLTKAHLTNEPSDAAWYSKSLVRETIAELGAHASSMREALRSAGERVARGYRGFEGADALDQIDLPNGSLVAMRWDDAGRLEVASLGDCTTVIVARSGSCVVLHDSTLDALDDQNYERMYEYAVKNGVSMHDARVALNNRFIENRLKMNRPGGYWAVDISCRGYGQEWVMGMPVDDVAGVVTFTDGYAAAVSMGVAESDRALARGVLAGNGKALGEQLRAAEQADEGCWRRHRSKTSDDATYMAIRFC